MTVYFSVWHSHCTRARFTVLESCRNELAVMSLGSIVSTSNFSGLLNIKFQWSTPKQDNAASVVCGTVWIFVLYYSTSRGVTRLDGARGKKQVWRPHVRNWASFWKQLQRFEESTCDTVWIFRRPRNRAPLAPPRCAPEHASVQSRKHMQPLESVM